LATAQKHLQRLLQAGRSTVARISHESPPREAPAFDDYAKRRREQSKQSKMKKKLFFLHFLPSREEALYSAARVQSQDFSGFFFVWGVKFVSWVGGWIGDDPQICPQRLAKFGYQVVRLQKRQ